MYPKFIEVHMEKDGETVSINVSAIELIADKGIRVAGMPTDRIYTVAETYEELQALVKDCGCLIHKQDPRLDTEHPLTMHDLQGMLGEPVWNSNTGKWTLVRNYIEAPDPDGVDVAFLLDAADNSTGMTAGDLIKTPLYRMKETRA